jgi:hypothetical protein
MTMDSMQRINDFIDDPATSEFARTVLCKALNREVNQSLNDLIKVKRVLEEILAAELVINHKKFKG